MWEGRGASEQQNILSTLPYHTFSSQWDVLRIRDLDRIIVIKSLGTLPTQLRESVATEEVD